MKVSPICISLLATIMITASTASAEILDFSCGNVEFTLDTQKSTMSDRFSGERTVEWKFEEPRLLWKEPGVTSWSGVNVESGAIIFDGVEDPEAGCIFEDAGSLQEAARNAGSVISGSSNVLFSIDEVERDFKSLPAEERMGIQRLISEVYGIDIGQIDGVWGRRTGTTLMEMQSGFAERGWTIEEEGGAEPPQKYTDYLVNLANYYGVVY